MRRSYLIGAIAAVMVSIAGCSDGLMPSQPGGEFVLATLYDGAELTPNPNVVPLGGLQVRVRIATIASDCSAGKETRVSERGDGFLVEPFDHEPDRCPFRGAKLFLYDVVLSFDEPGPGVVWTRVRDSEGMVIETAHDV